MNTSEITNLQSWANYGKLHYLLEGHDDRRVSRRDPQKFMLVLKAPEYVPTTHQVTDKWVRGDYHEERGRIPWCDRVTLMVIEKSRIRPTQWTDHHVRLAYQGEALSETYVIPYTSLVCAVDISDGPQVVEAFIHQLETATMLDQVKANVTDVRLFDTILDGLKAWIANPRTL